MSNIKTTSRKNPSDRYRTDDNGLDHVTVETHPARDATHFRAILEAREQLDTAEAKLRTAVKAARDAGDSWTVIGAALDTSRQAAQQRFGQD